MADLTLSSRPRLRWPWSAFSASALWSMGSAQEPRHRAPDAAPALEAPTASASGGASQAPSPESPPRLGAEELFRRHAVDVARLLRRLGVRGPAVEDLVQQVFLVVHRKGGFEQGAAKPMTWLRAIAVRVAADHRKGERRSRIDADELAVEETASAAANPEEAIVSHEDREGLAGALAVLSFAHRVVFVLFELERESFETIARILGIPTGTVGSRLTAARERVLEHYRPKLASPAGPRRRLADPPRLAADETAPALLRDDLGAAVALARGQAEDEPRLRALILALGAEPEEVEPIIEKARTVADRLGSYETGATTTRLQEVVIHLIESQEKRRARGAALRDTGDMAGYRAAPPEGSGSQASAELSPLDARPKENLPRLRSRLRAIGFRQRAALVLYEIEGEPCAAIGRILDHTPPDEVRALLLSARRAILLAYHPDKGGPTLRGGAS